MSHMKKKFQFQKVLEDYDFMTKYLEDNEKKESSDETILLMNVENLDYEKCEKIFFLLRHSLTLQSIILKSERNHTIINEIAKSHEAERYSGGPVFYTKYVSKTLYQAITDYLYNSDRIKILAFKCIPITCDLPILCQGIRSNRSIRIIHFENCDICDDGCIQICQALRKSPIEVLGLVNCKLTLTSATWLAWLIREQSMLRTLISWNRYQSDYGYKTEQGIRKMIFNDNPGIKDNGAKFIISTLFDDNWITQIHMENTGLSDATCHLILKLLKQNKSLTIFDIARNHISSNLILERISEALTKTSSELDSNETIPKSVKRNVRKKKRNLKKKKSKNNLNKLLSDKSQQTSDFSLYHEPFIMLNSNTLYEKHANSYLIKHCVPKNEDIFQQSFNNWKLETSDIKQLDSMSRFHKYYGIEKGDNGNKKSFQTKNKLKERRSHFSINQNSLDQKDFRKNNCIFESYNDLTKGCKWLQSKSISSFKV